MRGFVQPCEIMFYFKYAPELPYSIWRHVFKQFV